ncbi:MAG: energy-coupling factor transporter transmembrane protein EcfT [Gracilibacteraceae bacterium]|jgi:energy-coupling factor transport system permease protein|nr:energy-coupling factor transporter transmembrane protein EcfT [Gracilibacteraceae bacterium]
MFNITLGRYLPGHSLVHRLDPRTKVTLTLLYLVALTGARTAPAYIILTVWPLATAALAGLSPAKMLRGLGGFMGFMLFMIGAAALTTPGTPLWAAGPLTVSREGLLTGVLWAARIVLFLAGSSLLTYTTTPIRLMEGLAAMLAPLRRLGLNPGDLALMLALALRFLPLMSEEAERITQAQVSRGACWEEGGPAQKARLLPALVVPLFRRAAERAEHLTVALMSRCYGDGKRTGLSPLRLEAADFIFLALALATVFVFLGW